MSASDDQIAAQDREHRESVNDLYESAVESGITSAAQGHCVENFESSGKLGVWVEATPKGSAAQVNPVAVSLAADYPLLWDKAGVFDFAERAGGCTDPLLAEIDRAMHELWLARTNRETT